MMKRLFPVLVSVVLLASPAGALKMSIWDRDMQTPLGAGESSGNRFNMQLVRNYSGPVVVLFAQTDEEKRNATYAGLQNRYDGVLKNGQLTLMPDPQDKSDRTEGGRGGLSTTTQVTPSTGISAPAKTVGVTLPKLLQQFKLTVSVQTTGQTGPAAPAQDGPPRTPVAAGASGQAAGGNPRAAEARTK